MGQIGPGSNGIEGDFSFPNVPGLGCLPSVCLASYLGHWLRVFTPWSGAIDVLYGFIDSDSASI